MGKLITVAVAVSVAFLSYRAAHLYFIEKKLRHSVWSAIDPASSDDTSLRDEILLRTKEMHVRVDPDSIKISAENVDGTIEPSGLIRVVRRIRSVSVPYEYRILGAVKSGTISVSREVALQGSVGGEGVTDPESP